MSVPILGGALPASAASAEITSPADGAVITSAGPVRVTATTQWNSWRLVVVSPGGSEEIVAGKSGVNNDALSGNAAIGNNGRYEVRLQNKVFTWATKSTRTFDARVPPASPGGVTAKASGGKLTVRWNRGLENDLTGYTVTGGSGRSKNGSADSLCAGTNCSTTFSLPSSTSGRIPVRVRAKRSNGSGGSVYSSIVTSNVTVAGGSTTAPLPGSPPPAYPSGSVPPSTSTPLTPFNNEAPYTLPSVQPNGATPGFAYPAPQVANQMTPKAENIAATDRLQWGKSVGIALILLVVAAHLGTWTRSLRVSQAGVSRQGMAARLAHGGTGRSRVRKAREQIARAEAIAKTSSVPVELKKTTDSAPARAGDTAVLTPPTSTTRPGRRPATLGKRSNGVNVRIAKPAPKSSATQPETKKSGRSTHARGRGRRRSK
ncbi:hypothetical protein [Actinomadura xylanilytica]|uniref:hypothetical protein n=1 Tax=Actinomadura xylanilytica TaxID=887459 RepID=UPI00255AD932|nr:hypothetical protein [Actinomadura xylanilytica]MDL4773348.1 hypothetical protein [Actinomadura xylanilytica]